MLCQEGVHAPVLPRDRRPEYEGERVVCVPRDGGEEGDADGGEEAKGGGQLRGGWKLFERGKRKCVA